MTAKGKHIKAPKVTCPICGKRFTGPGLTGHMAWLHGKQSKAPLLPSTAMPRSEEKRKAKLYDSLYRATVTLNGVTRQVFMTEAEYERTGKPHAFTRVEGPGAVGPIRKRQRCPKGTVRVAIINKYPDGRVVKGFECLPKPVKQT